jgi:hypothetical protein
MMTDQYLDAGRLAYLSRGMGVGRRPIIPTSERAKLKIALAEAKRPSSVPQLLIDATAAVSSWARLLQTVLRRAFLQTRPTSH